MTREPSDTPADDGTRLALLKQIPPLVPRFLIRRRAGLPAIAEAVQELGIEHDDFFTLLLLNLLQGGYGGGVTLSQIRAYNPYVTVNNYSAPLDALVVSGLVIKDAQGCYSLSNHAKRAIDRVHAEGRAWISRAQLLPPAELDDLARQLERAVSAILADPILSPRPGTRLAGCRSLVVSDENMPSMARIEQAITDLWGARDDSHIKAWRDAGLEGPAMAVLTLVWSGEARTVGDMTKALAGRQSASDIESIVSYLLEKEYMVRDGDDMLVLTPEGALVREDIERETDRIYFTPWPHKADEALRVHDKLAELIDKLPQPPA